MVEQAPSLGSDRILDLFTFIPFLQDVQSVDQDASPWETEGLVSEALKQTKMAFASETEGLVLADVGSAESNCFIF